MMMKYKKGYSLIAWIVTFSLIAAALFFIRGPLKMALQEKGINATNYFLGPGAEWNYDTRGANIGKKDTIKYEGETAAKSKAASAQDQVVHTVEQKAGGEPKIKTYASTNVEEKSSNAGVEEGSESLLKTFNLNDITPDADGM
jgi:hypothetical protein